MRSFPALGFDPTPGEADAVRTLMLQLATAAETISTTLPRLQEATKITDDSEWGGDAPPRGGDAVPDRLRGDPLATTFADYLLPTAMEVPAIETLYKETPSPLNPLGAKGSGEVSTIPTAAAVISAIENALEPFGVRITQTPVTPSRLVELIGTGARS